MIDSIIVLGLCTGIMRSEGEWIGVDLGGTNLRVALVGQQGTVLSFTSQKTLSNNGVESVVSLLCKAIHQYCGSNIRGIGIGCPGPVDPLHGVIPFFPNLPGWKEVQLGAILRSEFSCPAFIINDANAAALGELRPCLFHKKWEKMWLWQ